MLAHRIASTNLNLRQPCEHARLKSILLQRISFMAIIQRRRWRVVAITGIVVLASVLLMFIQRDSGLGPWIVQGVLLRQDNDVRRQQPVSHAQLTLQSGRTTVTVETDSQGYFRIPLHKVILPGAKLNFHFSHADYETLTEQVSVGFRGVRNPLYVFHMRELTTPPSNGNPAEHIIKITNIRIRYVENATSESNIGSVARIFEAINQRNLRCNGQQPCSPDGQWKASVGKATLDAGVGNTFRHVRVSCIAGPCPFTRIDDSGYKNGGRIISASALDWSDTATFLVEAEVYHTSLNSSVHHLFPVFFGRTLNFTLPANEEGVSIEAELDGTMMVFPLGPDTDTSWTSCTVRQSKTADRTRVYHCELKSGFEF
jgi:hypothetical protein